MKENNNVQDILKKLGDNKPKSNYWGWIILAGLVFLAGDFFLRLYRLPWGIGMGVIILIVLIKWGIPNYFETLKENKRIRKENALLKDLLKKLQ